MEYHNLLKVRPDATREEIRKAYKKFAFHFHPDRNKGDEELFLIIQEAYEALMKMHDEEDAKSAPLSRKEIRHDLSFVKHHLSRAQIWSPDFKFVRRPKMTVESDECPVCDGLGILRNKFNLAIHCPKCGGSGHKTRIVIEPPS